MLTTPPLTTPEDEAEEEETLTRNMIGLTIMAIALGFLMGTVYTRAFWC